jgi:hypothetical protein
MIDQVINFIFRCSHRRLTRPISARTNPGSPLAEVYVVCLDCGKQFEYNWAEMRIGKPARRVAAAPATAKSAGA